MAAEQPSHSLVLKLIWYLASTGDTSRGSVTERSGPGELGSRLAELVIRPSRM
jgi:hypothetical protein